MQTYIVGARKPAQLGKATLASAPVTQASKATKTIPQGTTFAVVSIALAAQMQGFKSNKSKSGKGTMYACFNTYAKASALIKQSVCNFMLLL